MSSAGTKRPLHTEDSKADSNILLAKPKKHQKKIKEKDGIDTMRGIMEGRGERSDGSKLNQVTKEPISELLAIADGKAEEKIEKTDRSDAPLRKPLMFGKAASSIAKSKGGRHLDMAWEWNSLRDVNNKSVVTCDFCLETTTGGITRAKEHQMGLKGDFNSCQKIPPEIRLKIRRAYENQQTSRRDACAKKVRVSIVKFFRENGIPFNAARSKSFKKMIEAVGDYGKKLSAPSYPELKVRLLKKELGKTQFKCSIKSDATGDGEPSGVNTPHTVPTVTVPIEEKKEEKHDEKLVNEMTKPKVTKVYVRRKQMVKRLDDTTDQVEVRETA
ncbi:uncharacterized protein LOC108337410 isoform X2 [Vigna angularis]|uniref:uncharacterized protein LOC108337410 isoform X2 n=1 Tax=Phaseolus angularis TaxID=3914 RepID=UPI0008099C00|nr:uncharacterized protein LOC108337410 isoform X2 [Vigna angularis]